MLTHSMHHVLRLTVVAALMFAARTPAAGQQVRGNVVFADSATRARGIVILASDARGATVARALTNERGEFLLGLPGPGRYAARALHIGYRPTIVAPFDVGADETRPMRIVLGNDPVNLVAVRVRSDDVCGVRDGSSMLIVDIWDQVRTALSATQLTSDGHGLQASLLEYAEETERDANHLVEAETSVVKDVYTTHAFVSVSTPTRSRLAATSYRTAPASTTSRPIRTCCFPSPSRRAALLSHRAVAARTSGLGRPRLSPSARPPRHSRHQGHALARPHIRVSEATGLRVHEYQLRDRRGHGRQFH